MQRPFLSEAFGATRNITSTLSAYRGQQRSDPPYGEHMISDKKVDNADTAKYAGDQSKNVVAFVCCELLNSTVNDHGKQQQCEISISSTTHNTGYEYSDKVSHKYSRTARAQRHLFAVNEERTVRTPVAHKSYREKFFKPFQALRTHPSLWQHR